MVEGQLYLRISMLETSETGGYWTLLSLKSLFCEDTHCSKEATEVYTGGWCMLRMVQGLYTVVTKLA